MITSFQKKVFRIVKKIPRGKVTTYKLIAKKINSHPRAVGKALNANPYNYYTIFPEAIRNRGSVIRGDSKRTSQFFLIPCHRVIYSNGKIGGYKLGVKKKISLLKKEGIKIKNNKIINSKKFN